MKFALTLLSIVLLLFGSCKDSFEESYKAEYCSHSAYDPSQFMEISFGDVTIRYEDCVVTEIAPNYLSITSELSDVEQLNVAFRPYGFAYDDKPFYSVFEFPYIPISEDYVRISLTKDYRIFVNTPNVHDLVFEEFVMDKKGENILTGKFKAKLISRCDYYGIEEIEASGSFRVNFAHEIKDTPSNT